MKNPIQKPAIIYVVLLSVQVPFNIVFFFAIIRALSAENFPFSEKTVSFFYIVIAVLYFCTAAVLGVMNIVKSFQAYTRKDKEHCLKTMLILKYGMVPFFIVNFFSILALLLLALVASRGTIIFAFPIVIAMLLFAVCCTWFGMIPGAFYSIQVIRFGRAEGKISAGWSVWHMLLQFIFLADILDTIYLAVKKWNRGKAGAVIIGALYIIVIVLTIWLFFTH